MAATLHYEAHITEIRSGLWCDACDGTLLAEVDIAFVHPDTLEVMARAGGRLCESCGFEEHYRR